MKPQIEIVRLLGICFALTAILMSIPSMGWAAESKDYLRAAENDVQNWREMKFGLFIHWGPVSLKGTEIGWSRGGERRGTGGTGSIP
ncbi:MAG: alpha-L-fucosidase, partial [Sedimentisphaerales bacterium]|nr:alpha-L-fucosidase [Sedimentisphaerales bacterium]